MRKLEMLSALEGRWSNCVQCSEIATFRSKLCHWRGNPEARLSIIGDAPSEEDDRAGRPLIGEAGKFLDELLKEVGLDPAEDVFICNLLACRAPGDRQVHTEEVRACSPRLNWMLGKIIDPNALLLLGPAAARLTGGSSGIWERGEEKYVEIARAEGGAIDVDIWPAVITFHPRYYLRTLDGDVRDLMLKDIKKAWSLAFAH